MHDRSLQFHSEHRSIFKKPLPSPSRAISSSLSQREESALEKYKRLVICGKIYTILVYKDTVVLKEMGSLHCMQDKCPSDVPNSKRIPMPLPGRLGGQAPLRGRTHPIHSLAAK